MSYAGTGTKKTSMNSVRGEIFLHSVEEPLTEAERLTYADELTQLDTELKSADAVLQGEKGKHKTEVERIGDRSQVVMHRLRTRKEYKDVECHNDFDFATGICSIRRIDNGDVVTTRKINADEYKENLPFDKDGHGEIIEE